MARLRISISILFACALCLSVVTGAEAAPGDLDAAFGTNGVATVASGPDFDDAEPTDMAVAPDGKIVIVGQLAGPTNAYAFILRLLPSGARDPSFGTDGLLLTRLGPDFARFTSVVVQPNLRIVVAGAVRDTGFEYPVVARYTPDGGLDPTFNPLGTLPGVNVNTTLSVNSSAFTSLAMRPNGSFVGTGSVNGASQFWFMESVTATGELDSGFAGTGAYTIAFPTYSAEPYAIVARPDGRAVACGYAPSGGADQVNEAFVGVTAAGSLDGQFNGTGVLLKADPATNNQCRAMAIQSDGKLVSAAYTTDGSSSHAMALSRLNANGTPDTGFANGGTYVNDRGDPVSSPTALEIQPSGRILVIGRARIDTVNGAGIWARLPSGAPDLSFGDAGFVHQTAVAGWPGATALLGDQRLYMVGGVDESLKVRSVKLQPDPPPLVVPTAHAKITSPARSTLRRSKLTRVRGTATAVNGTVRRVEIAVLKVGPKKSKKCLWLRSNKARFSSVKRSRKNGCAKQKWLKVSGTTKWTYKLKKRLPTGKYTIYARATASGGAPEAVFSKSAKNRVALKLKP
ncbi:MAG: hypothetical protein JHC98_01920 [Thermoleophilaceae bacterium]|nr:hypothetical protein [Thermoleophilaceae bacterium]